MRRLFPLIFLTAWPLAGAEFAAADLDFFEKKIRPVLADNCYKCHSAKSEKVKGELLLDTKAGARRGGESGPAVVPRDLKKSLLIEAVRWTDEDLQMPPKKKLSVAQITALERWVQMGAPDPRTGGGVTVIKRDIDIEAGKNVNFKLFHGFPRHRRLVVMAEQMQHTMDDQIG